MCFPGMADIERVTPTPPTEAPTELPEKCSVKADAIVTLHDTTTWMFSRGDVWQIDDFGAGERQNIRDVFPDLEENIDAAYTLKIKKHTLFFKDSR